MLRGKCAYCKEKISRQYPVVELLTGLLFAVVCAKFGLYSYTWLFLFSICCLTVMTATDLKTKPVDCNYAIAMVVVGVLFALFTLGWGQVLESVIGAVIGFAVMELVARTGYLLKKGRAMGEADSYIAGALGAVVGYHCIGWVLLYSLIASMVFVLPAFWYSRYKDRDAITLFLSSIFIMSMALTVIFNSALWTLATLGITGLALAFWIIKSLKTDQKVSYLPFVPALSAGFLYYIIFVV
jgi:leader peptidase (prepilin peptidase)/N-methyltransferase